MKSLRVALPSLLVLAGAVSSMSYAQTSADAAAPSNPAAASQAPHAHHAWRRGRGFSGVLRQLELTDAQKAQVKAIFERERPRLQTLMQTSRGNRTRLLGTSPNDPNYPVLLADAKANASARIQLASDIRADIYGVLTPDQQAKIPALLAARAAKRGHHRTG